MRWPRFQVVLLLCAVPGFGSMALAGYAYDGQSIIEERDVADALVRRHINGGLYIDEHLATFTQSTGTFSYYLHNRQFSVAGTGNPEGTVIDRLDFGSTGSFVGGIPDVSRYDADMDEDLDLRDFASFQRCFGTTTSACLADHDFNIAGAPDGQINLADYDGFQFCFAGPFGKLQASCTDATLPPPNSFALHGAPVDVLSDGLVLQNGRARNYDVKHGRWLQRDPLPYNDGFNLYESFQGNPLVNSDPSGEGILTWLFVGDYSLSDATFIRLGGLQTAAFGYHQGQYETILAGATEFGRIFTGESAAQRRLVYLVEAEFAVGGTENASVAFARASRQGIVDFFGFSNIAAATSGELLVFEEGGQVYFVPVGASERVQLAIAGTGQFAGVTAGLAAPALSSSGQLFLARTGLQTARSGLELASRVVPPGRSTAAFFLEAGLAIERAEFSLATPAAAQSNALTVFLTRRAITPQSALLQAIREAGGTLAITRGTLGGLSDLSGLTRLSGGNEFALFRDLATRQLLVRELGPIGGEIPGAGVRLLVHSQPGTGFMAVRPSTADRIALTGLQQRSSVIIDESGYFILRFGQTTATDNQVIDLRFPLGN